MQYTTSIVQLGTGLLSTFGRLEEQLGNPWVQVKYLCMCLVLSQESEYSHRPDAATAYFCKVYKLRMGFTFLNVGGKNKRRLVHRDMKNYMEFKYWCSKVKSYWNPGILSPLQTVESCLHITQRDWAVAKGHSVPQNLQCLPSGPAQQVSANPWVKCMLLAKEEVGCHLSGCGCSLPTHRNYPFGTFRTLKLPCLLFFIGV